MKKHLNLRYKKELNQKSTFVAPKASFRAFTEAVVKCASSVHCALALLSPLSRWLHRLSLLPALVPGCAFPVGTLCMEAVAAGACAAGPGTLLCALGARGALKASPSPCAKVTVCGWFVTLQSGAGASGMCL